MNPNRDARRQTSSAAKLALFVVVAVLAVASSGCNPGAAEARNLDAACAEGDASSCNQLGYKVRQGEYVLADWRRAAELFRQACDGGEGEGCIRLAVLHVHERGPGRGVPRDTAAAVALFQRGCQDGSLTGCTALADMYVEMSRADTAGAPALHIDAANLYDRACRGDELTACTRLGLLYGDGRGVGADPLRAAELHARACDGGASLGCVHLGRSHEMGQGVNRDVARAATLYEQACEVEMTGCFRLADLYTRGVGVSQDHERAAELFEQACRGTLRGDEGSPPIAESCFRLADMIVNGNIERPLWRASGYFRSACALGYEDACGRS